MNEIFSDINLLIGIISGIIATFLFNLIVKTFKYFKNIILNRMAITVGLKSKILSIYNNQNDAMKKICEDVQRSKKIYIFTSGDVLFDITGDFYKLMAKKNADVRMLITEPSFHGLRLKELEFPATTENVVNAFIKPAIELGKCNEAIKIAYHKEFIRNKFYIFDDILYLGFRLNGTMSHKSQIYRVGKDSYLYKAFSDQFNDYWNKYYTSK